MFNVLFWSDNLEQHKTDIRNFSTLHKGFFPYTKLLYSTMRIELQELKKEMIARGVNESIYAIDTLPSYEGFCIYDARSEIEVFYFERGNRFEPKSFKDVQEAVTCFKQMVFNEK